MATVPPGQKLALDIACRSCRSSRRRACRPRLRRRGASPRAPARVRRDHPSDVLEHVLDPEAVVARLADVCRPGTRVIVHVPWNEDLAAYADSDYEFTHLRKFTSYSFARLFRHFYIRRTRPTWRSLEEPIVFKVMDRVPRFLQGAVSLTYFLHGLAAWEARKRSAGSPSCRAASAGSYASTSPSSRCSSCRSSHPRVKGRSSRHFADQQTLRGK